MYVANVKVSSTASQQLYTQTNTDLLSHLLAYYYLPLPFQKNRLTITIMVPIIVVIYFDMWGNWTDMAVSFSTLQ